MPWFIDNTTHHILWYEREYNMDYMDGLVDKVDDEEECYLIIDNEIIEQNSLVELVDDFEESDNTYIIPMKFYDEEQAIIEPIEEEIQQIDEDSDTPFKLVRDSESPVYRYKSPKDKYGI